MRERERVNEATTARPSEAHEAIVFLGSGAFGVPTLERLAARGAVSLVVSQPDKPAGRGRATQPTPIAARAISLGLPLLRSADVSSEPDLSRVRSDAARVFVVIAFGQKLRPPLLVERFAINLHGSLLPRWRGAAPIQRAVMEGDETVGVSVISIAERMDAGLVYASAHTPLGRSETAGDLHDRLAQLGPDLIDEVLRRHAAGSLHGEPQDASKVTRAGKLSRADAWVDFAASARLVAARINGLSPWPGCDATIDGSPIRLLRARVASAESLKPMTESGLVTPPAPGTIEDSGLVHCGEGLVELLEVQPPGGRVMSFDAWRRGRGGVVRVASRAGPTAER